MDRLKEKMGSLTISEVGSSANNEIRGVVFDFGVLMDNWNTEVKDLPPEKVIRDFNYYLFSGLYQQNVTSILALGVPRLSAEKLDKFSTLLNFYHLTLKPNQVEEIDIVRTFIEDILIGFRTCAPGEKCAKVVENHFTELHTKNWDIDISNNFINRDKYENPAITVAMKVSAELIKKFPKGPDYKFAEEFSNELISSSIVYKKILNCPSINLILGKEVDEIDIEGDLNALDPVTYKGLSKMGSLSRGQCAVMYVACWRLNKLAMEELGVLIDDDSTAYEIINQIKFNKR